MPPVVMTRSPVFRLPSNSCSFLRCCDWGRMRRKYQMPRRGRSKTNGPNGLDAPASAAKRIGFTMRHSINAGHFFYRIFRMRSPPTEHGTFSIRAFQIRFGSTNHLELRAHPVAKFRELSKQERLPHSAHSVKVKVDIVVGGQDRSQHFAGYKKVPKVTARIALAHRTGARGIQRPLIPRVARVLDNDLALGGERAGIRS